MNAKSLRRVGIEGSCCHGKVDGAAAEATKGCDCVAEIAVERDSRSRDENWHGSALSMTKGLELITMH